MPSAILEGPPIAIEAKRELVKKMNDAMVSAYGLPAQAMVITIRENPPENVAIGGCLLCDGRAAPVD